MAVVPRGQIYQCHDCEKIIPLIRKDPSALSSHMQICKTIENLKSHPKTCSRELSRQQAQKDENAGERDDCCTASDNSATLVRVQVRARRGQVGGHDCIRSEGFWSSG